MYGIHWFRRDLRIHANHALKWNADETAGKTFGVFCFDKKFLARDDFSANRFQFFLETLWQLKEDLEKRGGALLFFDEGPDEAFPLLFKKLGAPNLLTFNRDYEPFARERDVRLTRYFESKAVTVRTFRDHLLFEPNEVLKDEKKHTTYQVFTPFSRKWKAQLKSDTGRARIKEAGETFARLKFAPSPKVKDLLATSNALFERYRSENLKTVKIKIPKAGEQAAQRTLATFAPKLLKYPDARNIPAVSGTSYFSIYFKNGSLTVPQVIENLGLQKRGEVFLNELIWREFSYSILFHAPGVEKYPFKEKYRDLNWSKNESHFEKWKTGMTGYPIVDAGMRQLNATGWMHNRVRMIVGSFLVKDLLLDYRWGEKYFMHQLLDGDLAPNNLNWQWVASTGCDPQPYFRIFHPVRQSERFDPKGEYIKKWVPELSGLSEKEIHLPPRRPAGYPAPLVDHAEMSKKAIAFFKAKG